MEKEIWQMALERLGDGITPATITWLRQARLIPTQTPHTFILQIPSAAARKQVSQRFLADVVRAVADVLGVKQVNITVAKGASKHNATISVADERVMLFPADAPPVPAAPEPVAAPVGATPALAEALPVRAARMANDTRFPRDRRTTHTFTQPTPPAAPPPATPKQSAPPASKAPPAAAPLAKPAPPAARPSASPPAIMLATTRDDEFGLDTSAWINDRYTFENFIVGGGNQFAFAACQAVAETPGRSYNPLFLYGGVGLGKTHLMHAIAHDVGPRGARTLYITSETFTNEIVNAIRYRTTEEFRAKYRSVDVLLVDDVQFIAGKDSTEEEFFHTFNALHESQKQIVMCSDRPPKEIDLAERLRSRFEWGLIADIQPPDLETRLAILGAKAEGSDIPISDAVMAFLAEKVTTNVRVLEGLLTRVVAFARIQRQPVTVEMAKQAILSITPSERPRKAISIREILVAVSTYYKVSLDDLRGKQRDKHIVMPRQVAMWLMRNDTEASLMEVGHELGGRDHSTVLHGCDKIEQELRNEDSPLIQEIEAIRQSMAG
jgi:chromosomal replication initiator protein